MSDIESYLILKYGSLSKAFHMWVNSPLDSEIMSADEYNAINKFFADKSLRERIDTDHVSR